ncbi:hypothetical protein [Mycoplasma tauri]|uniref:hypothetical protein n=1 Tax=Mycoplasma tauri TaxID=547987 RepID=UPI001CBC24FE|nr:hypothetical protein [Mycoplasma tauri]MBZ4226686.1 hypothetical protein [Mycoplasma tauri]
MKKTNKILNSYFIVPLATFPIILTACGNNNNNKNQNENNITKAQNSINELEKIVNENRNSIFLSDIDIQKYDEWVKNNKKNLNESNAKLIEETSIKFINETKSKKESTFKKPSDEILQLAKNKLKFSYPNISETKLKDADEQKIEYILPNDFEFSTIKFSKNEETQDITIIYKLKMKNSEIEHNKNQFFELKGWAKSDEQIEKEKESQNKLEKNLDLLKVRFLNEKAYKNVLETNSINNYENKPNFVVFGYEEDVYIYKLNDLVKKGENDYTIKVKLSLKSNDKIFKEKIVEIDKEKYGKKDQINPHALSKEEQIKFLESEIDKLEIYPMYSRDKTFLERKQYDKLTDKSYWKSSINHQLNYEFSEIKDENDSKKITVKVSFADFENSPSFAKEININLNKLGIEELNKIKKEKGQAPVEDQYAPEATIQNNSEFEKINLEGFKDTDEDEKITSNASYADLHRNQLKNLKKAKFYILNEDVKNKILKDQNSFLVGQHFVYDNEKFKTKSEIFFYTKSTSFSNLQNVFIFSKPLIENNKIKSIKVTYGSLTEIQNKDYSNLSSTRVELLDEFGETELKRLELTKEIEIKKIHEDPTYNGQYTEHDFDVNKLVYKEDIPEGFTIVKPIEKPKASEKSGKKTLTVSTYYQKNGIKSYSFKTKFPLNN